jgi:AmmeMemoRadiSam system protein B
MTGSFTPTDGEHTPQVRMARFAGSWYPGNATALRRAIDESLQRVPPVTLPGPPLALISPHAGYTFSYPIAAYAYAQVRGMPFHRVVLLGPLHRPLYTGEMGAFMTSAESAYATPLGQTPLDHDFISALSHHVPLTRVRDDEEHALEIELPLLQRVLEPEPFTLVPLLLGLDMSDPDAPQMLDALAAAIAQLMDEHTLLVCSTDLSHLHRYQDVVRTDQSMTRLVEAFDISHLVDALAQYEVIACGAAGLVTVLRAAQRRGAAGARVLRYQCSGDITGDKRPGVYTVGYMAAVVYGAGMEAKSRLNLAGAGESCPPR